MSRNSSSGQLPVPPVPPIAPETQPREGSSGLTDSRATSAAFSERAPSQQNPGDGQPTLPHFPIVLGFPEVTRPNSAPKLAGNDPNNNPTHSPIVTRPSPVTTPRGTHQLAPAAKGQEQQPS